MPITFKPDATGDDVYLDMKDCWRMNPDRPSPNAVRSWLQRINAPLVVIGRESFIRRADYVEILQRTSVK